MAHIEAFFLPMEHGERFCVLHPPAGISAARGAILFVPPFAEEMNKSRRMVALQARAFANAGWMVLVIDMYGSGDSAGEFGDATWQHWIDDIRAAFAWLSEKTGRRPTLWSLRAGCLLAAEVARGAGSVDLVMWQPTLSGKQLLQQFLRLKLVNRVLAEGGAAGAGTPQLRDRLASGETIEVAGYALSPALASGMEAAELTLSGGGGRTAWFEISGAGVGELSPAAKLNVQKWRDAGHLIDTRVVAGPPFWQTVEIEECPALIAATMSLVEAWTA